MQNLYQSVDSIVLGQSVSTEALAAVSVCSTITNLIVGFCNGMSFGSNVVVAKAFGSRDNVRLNDTVRYTYTVAVYLGLIMSVAGLLLSPELLRLTGASGETFDNALIYLNIYISGMIFTVVYNNTAGILRGLGDRRTPLMILCVSCVLNVGLDLLFCNVLGWEIAGVAVATVIAQAVSVVISYCVLIKRYGLRCFAFGSLISKGRHIIAEAVDVGIASGIQSSIIAFSNMFVWRYVNLFSPEVVAGVGIGHKIDKFVSLTSNAFGNTVTTFLGQNIGAEKHDRIKRGIRTAFVLSIGSTLFLSCIVFFMSKDLARIFSSEENVVVITQAMTRILIPFYAFVSARAVLNGVLRAHKRTKFATLLSLAGMVGVRQIFLAITMKSANPIVEFIYYCYPVGWIAAFAFVGGYYLLCRRKMFAYLKTSDIRGV